MQNQAGRELGFDVPCFLFTDLTGHQQRQPPPVPIVVVNLLIRLRHGVFHQRLQRVEAGPRPVDHKIAIGAFKLPELERDLIRHAVLSERRSFPVHDLPAGCGDLQGDGARILASENGTIRRIADGGRFLRRTAD